MRRVPGHERPKLGAAADPTRTWRAGSGRRPKDLTMSASGRTEVHPPSLHSEFTVYGLSAVAGEVWAVGLSHFPDPALIAHTAGGEPWQLISYPSSEAKHTQLYA